MKPFEILTALPQWTGVAPDAILDAPAFSMQCRLGEETMSVRHADVLPAVSEMIALSVFFGDEPHALLIARSPRFTELDKIWDARSDLPEPILLALVEKDCGPFFQMLENAVRRQMRLAGLLESAGGDGLVFLRASAPGSGDGDENAVDFGLTRSAAVVSAFGVLRNLDLSHESIRSLPLSAELEYASFALPYEDRASLAPGDALLLPEIGSTEARLIVDRRFVANSSGVAPFKDDGRLRVVAPETRAMTLGELFDRAENPAEEKPESPSQLKLAAMGKTVAAGYFGQVASSPAFIVESAGF